MVPLPDHGQSGIVLRAEVIVGARTSSTAQNPGAANVSNTPEEKLYASG
jgi:hypothetical protein